MKRCEQCGGEFADCYPTHCMANFNERGRQTDLLGRYVKRAEKAEAEVERLRAELDAWRKTFEQQTADGTSELCYRECYLMGTRRQFLRTTPATIPGSSKDST